MQITVIFGPNILPAFDGHNGNGVFIHNFFTALQFGRELVEYCAFSFSHKYYNVIVVAIVKLLCRLKAKKALVLVFGAMKSLYCGIVRELHSVENY